MATPHAADSRTTLGRDTAFDRDPLCTRAVRSPRWAFAYASLFTS